MENRHPSPYPTHPPHAAPPTVPPRRYLVEHEPGGHPVRDVFLGVAAAVVAAVVVAVVLVAVVVVVRGPGTDPTTGPVSDRHRRPETPPPTVATAEPTHATAPDTTGEPTSKGWRLDTYRLRSDGLGDFSGTAIVTNLSGRTDEVFVFTLLLDGRIVATLTGGLTGGNRGDQATVELFSADSYQAGTFETRFQANY